MKTEKNNEGPGFFWGVLWGALLSITVFLPLFLVVPEIRFSINKRNIVKAVRLDYEKRQKELEDSYTKREKTPEQKLIEAVTEEIKK